MKNIIQLSKRLCAISERISRNVNVIDVGTDHAYIPIYLAQTGECGSIIASDVASEPLAKAERNINVYGYRGIIKTVLSDGLNNIDIIPPCDVVIAGMGGEMITKIIDSKPELKNDQVHLILQPMTKAASLREYLCENGFTITDESLADEGKIYQIISCEYTGKRYLPEPDELMIGIEAARHYNPIFRKFVKNSLDSLMQVYLGKKKAGIDVSDEIKLKEAFEAILILS